MQVKALLAKIDNIILLYCQMLMATESTLGDKEECYV